jgi:hypothetical protein
MATTAGTLLQRQRDHGLARRPLLDDLDFKIDDEFAHGLGATMLNMIALSQPDIKQYMTLTPSPVNRPSGVSGLM